MTVETFTPLAFPLEPWAPTELPHVGRAQELYLRAAEEAKLPKMVAREPRDPARRLQAREDLVFAAGTYFRRLFSDPVDYHINTLRRLESQMLIKTPVVFKFADATSRGIGKTTDRRIAVMWGCLNKHLLMAMFLGFSDEKASPHVAAIKNELFHNEMLFEDFPEICGWARDFGNDSRRVPAGFHWNDDLIKLPNFTYILSSGLAGAVGINFDGVRPDYVVMDDVEDSETAHSEAETKRIGNQIDQQVLQLHNKGRRAIYEIIGTVRTEECNVARYTDPVRSPGWAGQRNKALMEVPKNEEYWLEFIAITKREKVAPPEALALSEATTALAIKMPLEVYNKIENEGYRAALKFYVLNKIKMDEGVVLLDPFRLPVHECYRTIAEDGIKTFSTELQNEPLKDDDAALETRKWNTTFIASHASDYDPMTLPADCPAEFVTVFADVHSAVIYYSFRAWARDGTSWGIEQGVSEVYLHTAADQSERERALLGALQRLHAVAQDGFKVGDKVLGVRLGLMDEGWETNLVRDFCRGARGLWRPTKGFGGLGKPRIAKSKECGLSLNIGVDHFKHDCARLLERGRKDHVQPGYFHLHRNPSLAYQQHMCSEVWEPKSNKAGTDVQEYHWNAKNRNNHWWDCEVGTCVAAYLCGVRFSFAAQKMPAPTRPSGMGEPRKPSAAELGYGKSEKSKGWKIGR